MSAPEFDLAAYDAVAFDLDGTLWEGRNPIPGAPEFVERCRAQGLTVCFATNIAIASQTQVRESLLELGLAHDGDLVVTSSVAVANAVAARDVGEVAFIGGPGMQWALDEVGVATHPIAVIDVAEWIAEPSGRGVVMGGWPAEPVGHIEVAGRLAARGLPMFVPSLDAGYPTGEGAWAPGAGMLVTAARTLHQFEPIVCGKPSVEYGRTIRAHVGEHARLLMVGDAQFSDVGLAHAMNADSVWLANGRGAPVPDGFQPTYVVERLAAL